jgi:zinc protease
MKRHSLLVLAPAVAVMLGLLAPAAWCQAPAKAAAPPQAADQKKGTGVMPTGTTLAAQMPAAAPPKPFQFPKAAAQTLGNGLRTFVVTDTQQPSVTVLLVIPNAGAADDPTDKAGVANMTADMLTQGTATRSAQQIAEAIDFVGGVLSASADEDATTVAVTVVKKDFALAMDLLSDIVVRPAFKQDELDRRRQQGLSGLQVQHADPAYIAGAALKRIVYGQHPYGLPNSGTPESLRRIERDDLVRFREAHYAPERALLGFAGDITPEAAGAAADKYLGPAAWPKRDTPTGALPTPAAIKGLRVVMVDKPDANQTQIHVGSLGIARNNADYIPLYVTNRIFGGGFNSRLSTEVRQKKGLTYGAYSSFNSYRQAGDFSASTFTRTEATVEATRLVVDLIGRMTAGDVEKAELDFARDYIAGVFPIQSETGTQVATRILGVTLFGLPADFNDTYQQRVLAVGQPQVKAMAGRYFDARNLVIVLVGNVKQFNAGMRAAFPGAAFETLPFAEVDLLAPGLRRVKAPGTGGPSKAP